MTEQTTHPKKLFGRRKGWKLSAHQQALVETRLPLLTVRLKPGADPRGYFDGKVRHVWLEVGFGGGEHLLWQAEQHPDAGMIGCEPFVAGVAKLLSKISLSQSEEQVPSPPTGERVRERGPLRTERSLDDPLSPGLSPGGGEGAVSTESRSPAPTHRNLLVYPGDATEVIDALPDASLGRVFVLFPDPWPKRRHHKRRFLQTAMFDRLARVMRMGAELRVATDDAGYLSWALERAMAHPSFQWTAQSPAGWRARPEDWPPTRYEEKALHGRPYYLSFIRV